MSGRVESGWGAVLNIAAGEATPTLENVELLRSLTASSSAGGGGGGGGAPRAGVNAFAPPAALGRLRSRRDSVDAHVAGLTPGLGPTPSMTHGVTPASFLAPHDSANPAVDAISPFGLGGGGSGGSAASKSSDTHTAASTLPANEK